MEQEYKWNTTKEAAQGLLAHPLLAERTLPAEHIQMLAVYYDTPEGIFKAMRGALRLRRENQHSVCCMKVDRVSEGACTVREEYEVQADDIYAGLALLPEKGAPVQLCRQAAQSQLVELCRTEFLRLACPVRVEEDGMSCTAELAVDVGQLSRQGRTAPLSELEFEFKEGSTQAFHAFAKRMERTFGLEKQELSKLARAMAL